MEQKEKKPIYKKWWFWLIIVILIIGFAGSGSTTKPTISRNTVDSSKETTETTEAKERQVNVGDSVETSELKITYISCEEYKNYDSYSSPKSGNKVVRIVMDMENISDKDIYLNSFDCYSDGEKCESYYYADDFKAPTLEKLSTGKKMKAILYYEIPTSSTNNILEYETDYWTDEKVEFIIK